MMNFFVRIPSWIALNWGKSAIIASALGFAVFICIRCLETDKARAQRAHPRKEKEVRALADKISAYGRKVHRRFPTGDVVVGERDLAEELRKRPDLVATALNVLLGERKVQKAPLNGYWKLKL